MQGYQTYLQYIRSEINLGDFVWMLFSLFLVYIFYRLFAFCLWYHRWFKFFNSCPGFTRFDLRYGNLREYPLDGEKLIKVSGEMVQKFPKYFRVWFGPINPVIVCHHPGTIRPVIKTSVNKPLGLGEMYTPMLPWLGRGILLSSDQQWVRARKIYSPKFHSEVLRSLVHLVNEAVDVMMGKIYKHAEDGTSFDMYNMSTLCTFDIMLKWAFSLDENIQQLGYSHQFTRTVSELSEMILRRNRHIQCHFDFIYYLTEEGKRFKKNCEFVHRWAENIIVERMAMKKNDPPRASGNRDLLDLIIDSRAEDGKEFSLLETRQEVDNILFGGHDTTTSASSWILHSLASRPEMQARIQEEVDSVLADQKSKHITWNNLGELEYMSRCIKEGLRYHCPIPIVARRFDKEIEIEGKVFPVGTVAAISLWNLHHNPQVWDDPYRFDPDRFLPQNMKDKDAYSFIPFLAGNRNCLGKNLAMNQLKIIIGRILERFDLSLDESRPAVRKTAVVTKAKDGLWLFAKRRQQTYSP